MSTPAPTYVVTTAPRGKSEQTHILVWNSSEPLTLGHPFRWVLERTDKGVRVRELPTALQVIARAEQKEFTHAMLESGTEVELGQTRFRLKSARELEPVFTASAKTTGAQSSKTSGERLSIYACAGNWILDAEPLETYYRAQAVGKSAFILKREKAGSKWALVAKTAGLELRRGDQPAARLTPDQSISLGEDELKTLEIVSNNPNAQGERVWRFASAPNVAIPVSTTAVVGADDEQIWFQKSLRAAGIAFAAFLVMAWLWPKPPQEQELLPAQYAKIVLSQPAGEKAAAAEASGAEHAESQPQKNMPKKVQEAAVVQAFRAKALQSAVSGLLKGGMSQLLAQSDFVMGKEASKDARRIFDSKMDSLKPTAYDTGAGQNKNIKVATLGGEGGPGSKGVGYGKGEHGSVAGQGHSFVAMDIPGASVEEGLTKDEVGEVIHRHMSEVRYCYESAILRQPDIEGKLIVGFTIGGSGVVKSSEVKSSTLPDPRLDDCILRRLVTWKFPNTKGGIDVAVSYPFIFKTLGR